MAQIYIPGDATPDDVRSGKTFSAGSNYQATGTLQAAKVFVHQYPISLDADGNFSISVTCGFEPSTIIMQASDLGVIYRTTVGDQVDPPVKSSAWSGTWTINSTGFDYSCSDGPDLWANTDITLYVVVYGSEL